MDNLLHIVRGRTASYALPLTVAETGDVYTLGESERLIFAVKYKDSTERVLVKTLTHQVEGAYYLELTPEDTADLEPDWYKYDIALQSGATILRTVIPPSDLHLMDCCAELGDGA